MLAAGLAMSVVAPAARQQHETIYAVQQVLDGLARNPSAWIGRTALVRGTAMQPLGGCTAGQWCPVALFKTQRTRNGPALLLEPGPADPWVVELRHVPLVARMAPRPQRLRLSAPAVYRLLFQAVPGVSCGAAPCVNALLVDPAI